MPQSIMYENFLKYCNARKFSVPKALATPNPKSWVKLQSWIMKNRTHPAKDGLVMARHGFLGKIESSPRHNDM